ncbi:MAG: N-(5'-phosphoribosyl)anthranilate isomerase [Candidatus Velthaea sp.]
MRTRIKFCGCTSVRDASLGVDTGADAIGVIFAQSSPRRVSMETARDVAEAMPAYVQLVAVFVEPTATLVDEALKLGFVPQFSGRELWQTTEAFAAGPYVKVYHVPPGAPPSATEFEAFARGYHRATWMFEPKVSGMDGGTGRTFAWDSARQLAGNRRIIISGGLTPDNVADCIRAVRPYGVDVRSGIESNGVKDPAKMRAFVRAVKEADAQT